MLLPLAAPGLATTAILVFIFAWNEFLYALTFTVLARASAPCPVAISLFAGEHTEPWGEIAAASVIATLPLVVADAALPAPHRRRAHRRRGEGLSHGHASTLEQRRARRYRRRRRRGARASTSTIARRRVRLAGRPVGLRQVDARSNLIAGLETPDRGHDAHRRRRRERRARPRERDVAMVFQSYALYPHLDVRAEPRLPARGGRAAAARRSTRGCAETAELLGLEPLLDAQAARALRRPAAARGAGARAGAPAEALPLRRAAVQPRRRAARADARRSSRSCTSELRGDVHLRHPRPGRGDDAVGPGGGDERRARCSRWRRRASSTTRPANALRGGLLRLAAHQPGDAARRWACRTPRAWTLGVRPEHVEVGTGAAPRGRASRAACTWWSRWARRAG